MKDLRFGDVFIGYSEEVLHDDERAATFIVFVSSNYLRNVLVNFELPNSLDNGSDFLPISFSRKHASWSFLDGNNRRQFNPNYPLKIRSVNFRKILQFWLGGKVDAFNSNLSPGRYSGTIILTIEYL